MKYGEKIQSTKKLANHRTVRLRKTIKMRITRNNFQTGLINELKLSCKTL